MSDDTKKKIISGEMEVLPVDSPEVPANRPKLIEEYLSGKREPKTDLGIYFLEEMKRNLTRIGQLQDELAKLQTMIANSQREMTLFQGKQLGDIQHFFKVEEGEPDGKKSENLERDQKLDT